MAQSLASEGGADPEESLPLACQDVLEKVTEPDNPSVNNCREFPSPDTITDLNTFIENDKLGFVIWPDSNRADGNVEISSHFGDSASELSRSLERDSKQQHFMEADGDATASGEAEELVSVVRDLQKENEELQEKIAALAMPRNAGSTAAGGKLPPTAEDNPFTSSIRPLRSRAITGPTHMRVYDGSPLRAPTKGGPSPTRAHDGSPTPSSPSPRAGHLPVQFDFAPEDTSLQQVDALEKVLHDLQSECCTLRQQASEHRRARAAAEAERDALHLRIQMQSTSSEQIQEQMQSELQALVTERGTLTIRSSEHAANNAAAAGQADMWWRKVQDLRQEYAELQTKADTAQRRCYIAESQKEELQKKFSCERNVVEAVENELKSAREALSEQAAQAVVYNPNVREPEKTDVALKPLDLIKTENGLQEACYSRSRSDIPHDVSPTSGEKVGKTSTELVRRAHSLERQVSKLEHENNKLRSEVQKSHEPTTKTEKSTPDVIAAIMEDLRKENTSLRKQLSMFEQSKAAGLNTSKTMCDAGEQTQLIKDLWEQNEQLRTLLDKRGPSTNMANTQQGKSPTTKQMNCSSDAACSLLHTSDAQPTRDNNHDSLQLEGLKDQLCDLQAALLQRAVAVESEATSLANLQAPSNRALVRSKTDGNIRSQEDRQDILEAKKYKIRLEHVEGELRDQLKEIELVKQQASIAEMMVKHHSASADRGVEMLEALQEASRKDATSLRFELHEEKLIKNKQEVVGLQSEIIRQHEDIEQVKQEERQRHARAIEETTRLMNLEIVSAAEALRSKAELAEYKMMSRGRELSQERCANAELEQLHRQLKGQREESALVHEAVEERLQKASAKSEALASAEMSSVEKLALVEASLEESCAKKSNLLQLEFKERLDLYSQAQNEEKKTLNYEVAQLCFELEQEKEEAKIRTRNMKLMEISEGALSEQRQKLEEQVQGAEACLGSRAQQVDRFQTELIEHRRLEIWASAADELISMLTAELSSNEKQVCDESEIAQHQKAVTAYHEQLLESIEQISSEELVVMQNEAVSLREQISSEELVNMRNKATSHHDQARVTEKVALTRKRLFCTNGHAVTKFKEGLRWHQKLFDTGKVCDICMEDIDAHEPRWRCEKSCDFDVCSSCYDPVQREASNGSSFNRGDASTGHNAELASPPGEVHNPENPNGYVDKVNSSSEELETFKKAQEAQKRKLFLAAALKTPGLAEDRGRENVREAGEFQNIYHKVERSGNVLHDSPGAAPSKLMVPSLPYSSPSQNFIQTAFPSSIQLTSGTSPDGPIYLSSPAPSHGQSPRGSLKGIYESVSRLPFEIQSQANERNLAVDVDELQMLQNIRFRLGPLLEALEASDRVETDLMIQDANLVEEREAQRRERAIQREARRELQEEELNNMEQRRRRSEDLDKATEDILKIAHVPRSILYCYEGMDSDTSTF